MKAAQARTAPHSLERATALNPKATLRLPAAHIGVLILAALIACRGTKSDDAPEPRAVIAAPYDTAARNLPTDRPDPVALRARLASRDYDTLERTYAAYADTALGDARYERHLAEAVDAFWVADSGIGADVDRWVAARPTSSAARIARAGHRLSLGWAARGQRWSRETPDSSFAEMRKYFSGAVQDLKAALQRDPRSLLAYQLLISVARSQGDTTQARQFLDRSIEILPTTELNRIEFMLVLSPRWGGSYAAMEAFADACDSVTPTNPRLTAVRGLIAYSQAQELMDAGKLDEAWMTLEGSVRLGEVRAVRQLRGDIAMRQGRNLIAVQEYDRALALRPNSADLLYRRSYAAMQTMGRALNPRFLPLVIQAIGDGERAAALEPWDPDRRAWGESMRKTSDELRRRGALPQ